MDNDLVRQLIQSLMDASENGIISIESHHQRAIELIHSQASEGGENQSVALLKLLSEDRSFRKIFGSFLWRDVSSLCKSEIERFKEAKATRPLLDEEVEYMLKVLLPLYNEAVNMAVRAGVNVEGT